MTFLFDENLPLQLAAAFQDLGKPVRHVIRIEGLGRGAPDDEILRFAARHQHFLVTRDLNLSRKPHLRAIVFSEGVGVFAIGGGRRSLALWDLVTLLIGRWEDIERYAAGHSPPFVARVPRRGAVRPLR